MSTLLRPGVQDRRAIACPICKHAEIVNANARYANWALLSDATCVKAGDPWVFHLSALSPCAFACCILHVKPNTWCLWQGHTKGALLCSSISSSLPPGARLGAVIDVNPATRALPPGLEGLRFGEVTEVTPAAGANTGAPAPAQVQVRLQGTDSRSTGLHDSPAIHAQACKKVSSCTTLMIVCPGIYLGQCTSLHAELITRTCADSFCDNDCMQ